jgi:two-component system, OmpR family, sensor histidine kinase KdpD
VVHHAARRRDQAMQARAEAGLLIEFATTLLTASRPLPLVVDKMRSAFGVRSAALLQRDETGWRQLAGAGPDPANHP